MRPVRPMVKPWRPKRSRRNAQRAPGRTGPDCVMRGPLLVLGWPELSELEGCVGCRALAEHGLRSCRWTRLGGYASARRRLRKAGCHCPRARVGCTFVLDCVGWLCNVSEGRRAVGSVGSQRSPDGQGRTRRRLRANEICVGSRIERIRASGERAEPAMYGRVRSVSGSV